MQHGRGQLVDLAAILCGADQPVTDVVEHRLGHAHDAVLAASDGRRSPIIELRRLEEEIAVNVGDLVGQLLDRQDALARSLLVVGSRHLHHPRGEGALKLAAELVGQGFRCCARVDGAGQDVVSDLRGLRLVLPEHVAPVVAQALLQGAQAAVAGDDRARRLGSAAQFFVGHAGRLPGECRWPGSLPRVRGGWRR